MWSPVCAFARPVSIRFRAAPRANLGEDGQEGKLRGRQVRSRSDSNFGHGHSRSYADGTRRGTLVASPRHHESTLQLTTPSPVSFNPPLVSSVFLTLDAKILYSQNMKPSFKNCPQCGKETRGWAPSCAKCGHHYPIGVAVSAPVPSRPVSSALREMARLKSYTGACVLVMLLYCCFVIPGVVANSLFLEDARRMEALAGETLPGAEGLRLMWSMAIWGGGIVAAVFLLSFVVGGNR